MKPRRGGRPRPIERQSRHRLTPTSSTHHLHTRTAVRLSIRNSARFCVQHPRHHPRHGGEPIEIGGIADHIHIGKVAGDACGRRCVAIDQIELVEMGKRAASLVRTFAWQTGYAAFTVSKSQAGIVREYIHSIGGASSRTTFRRTGCAADQNDIDYDERYLKIEPLCRPSGAFGRFARRTSGLRHWLTMPLLRSSS